MPAPRVPVEIREFAEPDLAARRRAAPDERLRGVRHRRAPLARPARRRALSDHSRPRHHRHARRRARPACSMSKAGRSEKATASRSSTCIARAAGVSPAPSTGRRPGVRPAASTASLTRPPTACSAAGRRKSIWNRASSSRQLTAAVTFEAYIGGGCGLLTSVHIIERAADSLGDTVVVQGAGAVGLSAAALARRAGPARSSSSADRRLALDLALRDGRRRGDRPRHDVTRGTARRACSNLTGGLGADVVDRSRRIGARVRRRRAPRAQRRRLRHRRPLHERRRQHDQCPRRHQSKAPRHPRVLGQRSAALSPGVTGAGALWRPKCPGRSSAPGPSG